MSHASQPLGLLGSAPEISLMKIPAAHVRPIRPKVGVRILPVLLQPVQSLPQARSASWSTISSAPWNAFCYPFQPRIPACFTRSWAGSSAGRTVHDLAPVHSGQACTSPGNLRQTSTTWIEPLSLNVPGKWVLFPPSVMLNETVSWYFCFVSIWDVFSCGSSTRKCRVLNLHGLKLPLC